MTWTNDDPWLFRNNPARQLQLGQLTRHFLIISSADNSPDNCINGPRYSTVSNRPPEQGQVVFSCSGKLEKFCCLTGKQCHIIWLTCCYCHCPRIIFSSLLSLSLSILSSFNLIRNVLEGHKDTYKCFWFCLMNNLQLNEAASHIYASVNQTIIGLDNGLSPDCRQAIIWTTTGTLSIGPLGINFSEILMEIQTFSFKKMHLNCCLQNGSHFVSRSMC